MSRNWVIGLVIGAAVLAATAIAAVQSRETGAGGAKAAAKETSNLSGVWKLDVAKSDLPGRGRFGGRGAWGRSAPGRFEGRGEGRFEGRGEGPGRGEGRGWGRGAGRGRRLPDLMKVAQGNGVVSFSDSAGALIQEIHTDGSQAQERDTPAGAREWKGRWDRGTLIAEWTGPRGTMVQRASLADHGRTLEIRMERKGGEAGDDRGRGGRGREFKMVYRRSA